MVRLLIAAFLLLSAGHVHAQTALTAVLEEDYAPSVTVSGNLFVGAVRGPAGGALDLGAVMLPVLPRASARMCLIARTRDGQYWGRSEFAVPRNASSPLYFRPDGGWKHEAALAAYDISDFAAALRSGDACLTDPAAPLVPIRLGPGRSNEISIMINSQRAISARAILALGPDRQVQAECRRPEATTVRSTAFDMTCHFVLPAGFSGDAELSLNRRLRTGARTDKVTLIIPEESP